MAYPTASRWTCKGNVFATGPGGVLVYAPDGTLLGRILTGVPTANVAFGEDGSTLFITANHRVLRLRTKTRGMPLPVVEVIRISQRRGFHAFTPTLDRIDHRCACSWHLVGTAAFARTRRACWSIPAAPAIATSPFPRRSRRSRRSATKAGYVVDTSEDPEVFTAENLARYKALVLVSNSTDPKKPESEWFTGAKRDALQGFLKAGKGVVGLHAAADSHYHWGWYGQMIGGYFERHPKGTPKGTVTVVDAKHPATAKLPKTLERNDEWYYYKDFDPTVRVLITIDPKTIGEGEADVNPNPLVWCHDFGGGRVFYSGLGHTNESWSEPYMVDAA